jgi:adenosylcobyric acid synthase
VTDQVRVRIAAGTFLGLAPTEVVSGYQIHMGRLEPAAPAAFTIVERSGRQVLEPEGARAGLVLGTMIHGLLENASVRSALLASLRQRRGLAVAALPDGADGYDRLAAAARVHLDQPMLRRLAGLAPP